MWRLDSSTGDIQVRWRAAHIFPSTSVVRMGKKVPCMPMIPQVPKATPTMHCIEICGTKWVAVHLRRPQEEQPWRHGAPSGAGAPRMASSQRAAARPSTNRGLHMQPAAEGQAAAGARKVEGGARTLDGAERRVRQEHQRRDKQDAAHRRHACLCARTFFSPNKHIHADVAVFFPHLGFTVLPRTHNPPRPRVGE